MKRGRIINIGSISSRRPRPHTIGYAAAKFGLHGITQSMALDGRGHGITVSIIDPGVTGSHLARDAAAPKRTNLIEGLRPAGRRAVPGPELTASPIPLKRSPDPSRQ